MGLMSLTGDCWNNISGFHGDYLFFICLRTFQSVKLTKYIVNNTHCAAVKFVTGPLQSTNHNRGLVN